MILFNPICHNEICIDQAREVTLMLSPAVVTFILFYSSRTLKCHFESGQIEVAFRSHDNSCLLWIPRVDRLDVGQIGETIVIVFNKSAYFLTGMVVDLVTRTSDPILYTYKEL